MKVLKETKKSGWKLSVETRKRISDSKKNPSAETRLRLSLAKSGCKHPNFGKHLSEETRRKIAASKIGVPRSAETIRKISESKKNPSAETRRKISEAQIGRRHSAETILKMSLSHRGYKPSYETRQKMSKAQSGINNPMYGKTPSEETRRKMSLTNKARFAPSDRDIKRMNNKKIRDSLDYRLWREAVFKRDDYTCIWCKTRGGKLNADHIMPFSTHPELRLETTNGRTLCVPCHKKTDTFGRKAAKAQKLA